jgi:hypothetical protein
MGHGAWSKSIELREIELDFNLQYIFKLSIRRSVSSFDRIKSWAVSKSL